MRPIVTIVEKVAIASVQSICSFERRPIVMMAVMALKPIFRIWLKRPVWRPVDCAAEA